MPKAISFATLDALAANLPANAPGRVYLGAVPHSEAVLSTWRALAADCLCMRYAPTSGVASVRAAIADYVGRVSGKQVDARRVVVTAGGTQAVQLAIRLAVNPGDGVLAASPYWPLLQGILADHGAQLQEMPLLGDGGVANVKRWVDEVANNRTRAIYINQPSNPTGLVYDIEAELWMAQRAAAARWVVVRDIAYEEFFYNGAPSASMPAFVHANTIWVGTASKQLGAPGLRVGYLIARSIAEAEACERLMRHSAYAVNFAAQACLGQWIGRPSPVRDMCARRWGHFLAHCLEGDVQPSGGFYAFLRSRKAGKGVDSVVLMQDLVSRGVVVAPGGMFGEQWAAWFRVTFVAPNSDADMACVMQIINDYRTSG